MQMLSQIGLILLMFQTWKERIGYFVMVFFLPIFFTCTGLRARGAGAKEGVATQIPASAGGASR